MRKFLSAIALLFSITHAASSYELGEGYSIIDPYLYVGGYFSTSYSYGKNINGASLDDVALLAYGSIDKLSYIVEFESLNPYQYSFTSDKSTSHSKIYAERIFAKYQINENFSVKAGKFYTPVGFWNEIPINVLRDTTSNPLTVEKIYPKMATGLNLQYSSYTNTLFQIDLLAQNSADIDPKYNDSKIKQHYAATLTLGKDALTCKLSGGYYKEFEKTFLANDGDNDEDDYLEHYEHQKTDDIYNYLLFGFKYDTEDFYIQSEIGKQFLNYKTKIDYMGYIQGVYRYENKHFFIVRLENYSDDENERHHDTFSVLGYTYRPIYPIAIKTEYQFHAIKENDKALISLSVLF